MRASRFGTLKGVEEEREKTGEGAALKWDRVSKALAIAVVRDTL